MDDLSIINCAMVELSGSAIPSIMPGNFSVLKRVVPNAYGGVLLWSTRGHVTTGHPNAIDLSSTT